MTSKFGKEGKIFLKIEYLQKEKNFVDEIKKYFS